MFSSPVINTVNDVSGLTKEDELGLSDKQRMIELCSVNEEFKENYLNSYFESLNVSNDENDWSRMIIRALEFYDFADCKALPDMLDDRDFVFKYKYDLEKKFEEMVGWFLTVKMGISSRPIPPVMADERKIDLLGLYVMVERDGGYRSVTNDNLWPAIAKELGFEYENRLRYVFDKEMINEGESSLNTGDDQERRSADTAPEEAATEHYALYAGNSWEGTWNLHKKCRRFNFNEARKAVDEANYSVLMYATKHNQV
ncbi:putative transcription factor & chromatin remodeling ARID family [Helianthus anomalus]